MDRFAEESAIVVQTINLNDTVRAAIRQGLMGPGSLIKVIPTGVRMTRSCEQQIGVVGKVPPSNFAKEGNIRIVATRFGTSRDTFDIS